MLWKPAKDVQVALRAGGRRLKYNDKRRR